MKWRDRIGIMALFGCSIYTTLAVSPVQTLSSPKDGIVILTTMTIGFLLLMWP